jgi:hypothetical protein
MGDYSMKRIERNNLSIEGRVSVDKVNFVVDFEVVKGDFLKVGVIEKLPPLTILVSYFPEATILAQEKP